MSNETQLGLARRYVTAEELGVMIGFPPYSIWRMARNGTIPSVRVGRRVLFVPEQVFDTLEKEEVK